MGQLTETTLAIFFIFGVKNLARISLPDCLPPYFEVNNLSSDVSKVAREVYNLDRGGKEYGKKG